MTIYTVALPKGGTAKTATAAELVLALNRRGRRVLVIDLDQQGNLSTRMGITRETVIDAGSAQVLTAEADALDAAVPAQTIKTEPVPGVLVGTHELANVEAAPPADLIISLRDHLHTVAEVYDDVVIDTPPSATGLALAGLAAADVVIAPVSTATESYDQLARLEAIINERLAKRIRPGLKIDWIIPTRYDHRRTLDREIVELLHANHPGQVTGTVREAVTVKDAYTSGMTIGVYRPGAGVSEDYADAMTKILNQKAGQ